MPDGGTITIKTSRVIKEEVLAVDSYHPEALGFLKGMYEKRRDWEKLIRTMQREVELLPEDDRLIRYAEMADLAREAARHFGRPQDIEWALADGKFAIVQARPVTIPT